MPEILKIGSSAPSFCVPVTGNKQLSLSDYAGRYLVLYFYPKDDTSGCTKQAIGFSEHKSAFEALNTDILGISKDSLASHDKFTAKHDLSITLGADEDLAICEAYGVWVEKKMYGRTYMGIERSTFLIGPDGTLLQAWRKVRVPGHVEAVLEFIRAQA